MAGSMNWRGWLKSWFEPPHGVADSLIARGTRIVGDLRISGVCYFAGELQGHLEGEPGAMLILCEHGVVHGDIRCPYVTIRGRVHGNVEGEAHVHLEASARVEGHVYYRLMEMHAGAQVSGHLIRRDERHQPPSEQSDLPLSGTEPENS